jgi:ubiquinone/menaquinone biosynthesis C-methylase UbiE
LGNHYDRVAPFYEWLDGYLERFRYSKIRPLVWSKAQGNILDLGAGTGLNIPYYPPSFPVTAVDLSAGMLKRARRRAQDLGRPVTFFQMDAGKLGFQEWSFDTVAATFLFCVLPNEKQPEVLREVWRVLKPGGRLVLLEYVYSKKFLPRLRMKILSPWVYFLYRAGFDRKTDLFLRDGGWKIEEDVFVFQDVLRMIVARKPGA